MWFFETNKNELRETVDKLDKFYSDDDQVCNILIKISASVTILYLCRLINHSFQLGAFLRITIASNCYSNLQRRDQNGRKQLPYITSKCIQ